MDKISNALLAVYNFILANLHVIFILVGLILIVKAVFTLSFIAGLVAAGIVLCLIGYAISN